MSIDLANQKLPAIYKRGGRDCYLDPIRKRLIYITPEETVRQKVISYLIHDLKVPEDMILVEEHLSHYGIASKLRADIVVHKLTEDDALEPVLIVECKGPGIILGDKAKQQLIDYCDALSCDYAMLVNDDTALCYHYNSPSNSYSRIEALPEYTQLLHGEYKALAPVEPPCRVPHPEISEYLNQNLNEDRCDISYQTEHTLACAAFNLLEGLLDLSHKMPAGDYGLFSLLEDYGLRELSYGNASGGVFSGIYRSFLIQYSGSTEFVSISSSVYVTYARPDVMKTAINVGIDNEKSAHHALQLVLDDNVVYSAAVFDFYHHGRIGISNQGSGKVDELREFVRAKMPQLISGKKFFLGRLVDDRNWNLDDPEVMKLISNLISYALIRDEYRSHVKSQRS
jgi:hypothetical protein